MSLDQLDQALAGGGTKSAFTKDSPIGTTITGTVIDATIRQITDFATQKPKTWDDGRPQNQVVIRIQTTERLDGDDDGIRGVYIKTWGVWKEALNKAIRDAGGTKASDVLTPGAVFTATFTGTKPSTMGSPMKVYEYRIQPATTAGIDAALDTPQVAAAPAPTVGEAPADKVKQLANIGLTDDQIAQATGLDQTVVAAIRAA